MFFVFLTIAPIVWIVVTLSASRRNTARTVELLESAQPLAPPSPGPWEPDPLKWQRLTEQRTSNDESA